MRHNHSLFCLVLLLLCPILPAEAQLPRAGLAESIDVNIVNVDVYVADRRGNPVAGLTAKDFDLFDDDKKVKLSNFSEVDRDAEEEASLILYVDDTQISAGSRNRVLDALQPFVERLMTSQGTAVMVVRFDQLLQVEQDFTTDPAAIRSALDSIRQAEPLGGNRQALERSFRADVQQTMALLQGSGQDRRLGRSAMDGLFASGLSYGESLRAATTLSAEALTAVARSLGIRPGRKSLYFVGDGLAMRPLSDMLASFQRQLISRQRPGTGDASETIQTGPGPQSPEGLLIANSPNLTGQTGGPGLERFQEAIKQLESTGHFQRLGAIANASRVTLYPIKPPYVDTSSVGLEKRSSDSQQPLSNLREALDLMAESTGGRSMVAGVNVAAFLDSTLEDSAAHYSLGFAPREPGQVGFHILRVKGKSRSWRLRYRQSYVAKTLQTRLADRAVGTLTVHWVDNPHEIHLEIASQSLATDGTYDVTILLSLPIRALSLVEEGGIHSANCQVAVVVLNSEGQLSSPQYLQLPIQIPNQDLEGALAQDFGGSLTLRVPAGTQRVAVGFWEDAVQKGSFVSHEFTVGEG